MKKSFFVLSMLCAFISIRAQNIVFSGTWVFSDQESISGNLYSNGSPKLIKIDQQADSIRLEKTTSGADGDMVSKETLPFDGRPVEGLTSSKKRKSMTILWSKDKKSFTETTHVYDPADTTKIIFTYTDIYSLEGGQLVLQRKAENFGNGETWESKAVYEK